MYLCVCLCTSSVSVCPEHTHQLLEGRLVQVALQGELAQGFPRRLVGLNLHRVPLHGALMPDGTPGHQGRPGEALQVLTQDKKKKKHPQILQNKACGCICVSPATQSTDGFAKQVESC